MTPGNRLRRARRLNGYRSIKELHQNIKTISPGRLGRLERDQANPTPAEIDLLCRALQISADWWLRGDQASPHLITRKLERVSDEHRWVILQLIDVLYEKEIIG